MEAEHRGDIYEFQLAERADWRLSLASQAMRVEAPVLSSREGSLHYACRVRNRHGERTLWFEVQDDFAGMVVNSSEPALLALLMPAMLAGEDIHIDGQVCAELLWKIEHGYQELLLTAYPRLSKVSVRVSDPTILPDRRSSGVAAAFSGGIDSFHTLIEFTSPATPKPFRLTHLTYHLVGKPEKLGLTRAIFRSMRPVADEMGLPFVKIESNVGEFYNEALRMKVSHTTRDAAASYLLRNGIGVFLYSAGVHFSDVKLNLDRFGAGCFDSIALPILSTRGFEIVPAGAHLTRIEKTLHIAQSELARQHLNVCIMQSGEVRNCSKCSKCLRTMLCLEIAGELDRFDKVFDLAIYARERERYLNRVARNHDDLFLTDLREFARARGFPLPRRPLLRQLGDTFQRLVRQ